MKITLVGVDNTKIEPAEKMMEDVQDVLEVLEEKGVGMMDAVIVLSFAQQFLLCKTIEESAALLDRCAKCQGVGTKRD
jgi:hypothetical protein